MEKLSSYLEDLGLAGGAGVVLLVFAWAMVMGDLTNLELAKFARLPPIQIIATAMAVLGLLLTIHRLRQTQSKRAAAADLDDQDRAEWEKLVSFLKDRRMLRSLMDYEHLPRLVASVDVMRTHLAAELQSLKPRSRVRTTFEQLQEACRDFADAWSGIMSTLSATSEAQGPQHIIEVTPPINQYRITTAVGILRGQVAAIMRYQAPEGLSGGQRLVSSIVGANERPFA